VADPSLLGDRTIAQNLATAQAMVVTARRGMASTTSSADPTSTGPGPPLLPLDAITRLPGAFKVLAASRGAGDNMDAGPLP
jgi:hypothetical protein